MKIIVLILALGLLSACGTAVEEKKTGPDTEPEQTEKTETTKDTAASMSPTETVKAFIDAYQKKDVASLKKLLSKKSIDVFTRSGEGKSQTVDERLKEFVDSEELPFKGTPEMRNEKVDGEKATVEVLVEGKWEPTPLVKEDGAWKFDI
ncbi:MAG: DUF2950 family protein [Pyrinomonadaceae bacterium]|nr:DUF2950 family protein [Pyrinomonadaceae bacterium]